MLPVLILLLLVTPLVACPAREAAATDAADARAGPHPLERVVAIGASVTGGFQTNTDLGQILAVLVLRPHEPVEARSSLFFFTSPAATGASQIAWARTREPTLVVGLDFLFWFGYGTVDAEGGAILSEEERLSLLEHGLSLLDTLDATIVVGDFPDMSDAVGKMLFEAQVPDPETLDALNERLDAWAAERPRAHVVPLGAAVAGLRSGQAFRIGRHSWPEGSTDRVLLADRLHPTPEGLAATAHLIAVELVEAGVVAEEDVELDFGELLERAGISPRPGTLTFELDR